MAAFRADVLLFALIICSVFNIKKASFITSDGLRNTLNVEEVYKDKLETQINSSLWIIKKNCFLTARNMSKSLLFLLLIVAGDVELQPGPSLKSFTRKRGFKILHQNINGIGSKMDSVKILLGKKNIHVFGFTESHINASITDEEVSVDGYYVERLDRTTGSYGGVVCFIRNEINYERRKDLEMKGMEAIWIEVCFPKTTSILIFFMYKPPENSRHLVKNFVNKFENMIEIANYENKEIILAGDLNCDHNEIKDVLRLNALKQLIKKPTRKLLLTLLLNHQLSSAISDHDIIGITEKSIVRNTNHVKYSQETTQSTIQLLSGVNYIQ